MTETKNIIKIADYKYIDKIEIGELTVKEYEFIKKIKNRTSTKKRLS